MIKEISLISCKEILMANEKSSEQLAEELDTLEIPGNQNPWKKKDSRYTNTILSEAGGADFSSQTLSNIVRRDQNILEGVQNRTSLVIATAPVSEYEKLKYMTSTTTTTSDALTLTKVYTRNSESKNYFIAPPWKHKDDSLGKFKKAITRELHTQTINEVSQTEGETPTAGQFFDVLYTDHTQNHAKLLRKTKKGYTGIPEMFSSIANFSVTDQWPGNDNTIISESQTSKKKGSTMGTIEPPEGSIIEEVSKFWSPIYNPCASPPNFGNSVNVGSKFGPRIHPTYNDYRWHYGIDIGVKDNPGIKAGYPIVAIADGVIAQVGPSTGQPKTLKIAYVTIKHDLPANKKDTYSVKTRSMHLFLIGENSSGRLRVGDRVKAGEIIGYMGGGKGWPGSGATTGPHLHFEIWVSKKVNGVDTYDTYVIRGEEFDGNASYSVGAADPLMFEYPNIARFKGDEDTLRKLRAQLPTRAIIKEVSQNTSKVPDSEIPPMPPDLGESPIT